MEKWRCFMLFGVAVCAVTACEASVLKFKPHSKTGSHSDNSLVKVGELFKNLFEKNGKRLRNFKTSTLKTCGGSAVTISNFTLKPDTLVFPGTIHLAIKAHLGVKITKDKPVKITLDWKKKNGIAWITLPCVDGIIGSCTFDNICDQINFSPCPDILTKHSIPCKCPFNAMTYSLMPAIDIEVDAAFVPSGEHRIIAHATNNNKLLTCLEINFTISS